MTGIGRVADRQLLGDQSLKLPFGTVGVTTFLRPAMVVRSVY